ncbi:MAG: DinB family protein [Acidobacteriota bacterium]
MTPEQATFLGQQYAQLMQGEFAATCKVLAAVKNDTRDYKPDEKSRTAWELATHLATSDVWFLDSVISGKFVYDAEAAKKAESQFTSVAEIVSFYEQTFAEKLKAVQAMAPEDLARSVDFFGMMQKPAAEFLGMANNHSVHHRGQLAAYLRGMGSKVPAIYGGSADEPMPGA